MASFGASIKRDTRSYRQQLPINSRTSVPVLTATVLATATASARPCLTASATNLGATSTASTVMGLLLVAVAGRGADGAPEKAVAVAVAKLITPFSNSHNYDKNGDFTTALPPEFRHFKMRLP